MEGNYLSPFEDLFDAYGIKTIQETIYELIKVAMTTENIYYSKPEEREFLFYFEELLHDCIRKGYCLFISDKQ